MSNSEHGNEERNDPVVPQYTEAEYVIEEPEEEETPSPAPSAPPKAPEAPKPSDSRYSAPAPEPVRPAAPLGPEKEPEPMPAKKCSGLSIAAFICALTGILSLPALILSIIDLGKAKKFPRKRGLSIAALILSALILVSAAAGVIGVLVGIRNAGSREIRSIECGDIFLAGLRKDGTVTVAVKKAMFPNQPDFSAVSEWKDITALYTSDSFGGLIGLKKDGTLVACDPWGEADSDLNARLQNVKDVVSAAADEFGIYAVRKDGTAEIVYFHDDPAGMFQDFEKAQAYFSALESEVHAWKDLEKIKLIGDDSFYGWKKDGTVVCLKGGDPSGTDQSYTKGVADLGGSDFATVVLTTQGAAFPVYFDSDTTYGLRYQFPDWYGIRKMIVFYHHALGLKEDGTVVSVYSEKEEVRDPVLGTTRTYYGGNDYGQCEVSGWTDIVDICANPSYTFGLKKDGTVLVAGRAESFDLSDWNN